LQVVSTVVPWRRALALVLLTLLVACGQGGQETPTVVPVAPTLTPAAIPTETTAAVQASPTETPAPESEPATAPASSPTAAPTAPDPAPAGAPVSSISLAHVVGDLGQLTYLTHAGDERLFVTTQGGLIQIVQEGQVPAAPFLDIRDRVGFNASEQGLLSVAFHPRYAENGFFYVNYTDDNGDTVVSRFQVTDDANRADPGSETVLLQVAQPYRNHNGGHILFGPHGYLYVGMGDGGNAGDPQNNGQNPRTLLGALLRLDVDQGGDAAPYAVPPDNPYVQGDEGRPEVWAYGLRNPWRLSFDALTEDLYVADVGQNQYEEINFAPAGQGGGLNYGWNIMEAGHCYQTEGCDRTGLRLPVAEYSHPQGGCSVTGGYVYRGQQFPALTGNYFYGDYCSGLIWSLFQEAPEQWVGGETPVFDLDANITSFGQDVNGELYVVTVQGDVYQIQSP
jgi:glucose/arabinose dehydrogenase